MDSSTKFCDRYSDQLEPNGDCRFPRWRSVIFNLFLFISFFKDNYEEINIISRFLFISISITDICSATRNSQGSRASSLQCHERWTGGATDLRLANQFRFLATRRAGIREHFLAMLCDLLLAGPKCCIFRIRQLRRNQRKARNKTDESAHFRTSRHFESTSRSVTILHQSGYFES